MNKIIGRKTEISILTNALKSQKSELIAVYGRRRIGKTYLIRNVYKKKIFFEFSGIHKVPLKQQLHNFQLLLADRKMKCEKPTDWIEAFHQLSKLIERSRHKQKKVIFIDEFPWFDTRKSMFLPAFENFWNQYASKRNDIVLIICGSAASYMINKIIRNKGGLHNRLTNKIKLPPFNLHETEQLLNYHGVKYSRYDIAHIYLALGGVPFYLEQIMQGESVTQALDRLCFQKNGILRTEFNSVFASLFDRHENHEAVIRTLATVRKGLTRTKLLTKSKLKSGGTLTKTLLELEESGFIEKYTPYIGRKNSLYRLTDEYSLFYLKFIEKSTPSMHGTWTIIQGKQTWKIWSGFGFETICLKHIDQIKEGLKISGIFSKNGSWVDNGESKTQIDLLIDRDDNVINLCEIKFYNSEYSITKKYAGEIIQKMNAFASSINTKKNIHIIFITSYGLAANKYSRQIVQNNLTLDHLFRSL